MSRFNTMLAQAPTTRSVGGVVERWVNSLDEDDRKEFLQAAAHQMEQSLKIAMEGEMR